MVEHAQGVRKGRKWRGRRWAIALGVLVAVVPAQPAWACKCAQRPEAQLFKAADVVFTGRVRTVHGTDPSSEVRALLRVDKVRKGRVAGLAVVSTSGSSASCGVYFERGDRYLVYAHREGRRLTTNLCAGTARIDDGEPCPRADDSLRDGNAVGALLGEGADGPARHAFAALVDADAPASRAATALASADAEVRAGRARAALALADARAAVALRDAQAGRGAERPVAAAPDPAVAARPSADVKLEIQVRDSPGGPTRLGTLTCRGGHAEATGFLAGAAPAACQEARRLGAWLAAPPERGRACTMFYGGPQTAGMTGAVGDDRIQRRFSRHNGCAVEDWNRAALLLGSGSRPQPGAVLVDYVRSGGIAGLEDHLSVTRRGVATIARRGSPARTVLVAPERMRELVSALEKANFPRLKPEYRPRHPISDAFHYSVTYEGRTVRAVDTAVPPALEPVLEALNGIWTSAW